MYCPGCSTQSIEGAKFCKTCGMNLTAITQALTGGVIISDPVRDREYKRARKQISDGLHGSAVGAALLVAATLAYFLIPRSTPIYAVILVLALAGVIKLFRAVASIIDAKVGQKLLDPTLQPRGTGGLSASQPLPPLATSPRPSQRLTTDPSKLPPVAHTRPVSIEDVPDSKPPEATPPPARPATGRVNRDLSSPLSRLDKDDDLLSKLRN
jgi:hypothetical protein